MPGRTDYSDQAAQDRLVAGVQRPVILSVGRTVTTLAKLGRYSWGEIGVNK